MERFSSFHPHYAVMGMNQEDRDSYTREELIVLASARRGSGRTCRYCAWLSMRGSQRGCFPDNVYRKFLSQAEYEAGCERFAPREKK